jgi:hypothetical protein
MNQVLRTPLNEPMPSSYHEIRIKVSTELKTLLDETASQVLRERQAKRTIGEKRTTLLDRARRWYRTGNLTKASREKILKASLFSGSFTKLHDVMKECYLEEHPDERPRIGRPIGTKQEHTKASVISELVSEAIREYLEK